MVKHEDSQKGESMTQSLAGMIRRLTSHPFLREDLMQEAMIHLWLIEARRPGQTRSWYLQSCRYHLQHYLGAGRSVDSTKRRGGEVQVSHGTEDESLLSDQSEWDDPVLATVSAREIIGLLSGRLAPKERAVLDCLADGLGAREIGRQLKLSHTMVIRCRRKIADMLLGLGVHGPALRVNGLARSRKPRNGHHSLRCPEDTAPGFAKGKASLI